MSVIFLKRLAHFYSLDRNVLLLYANLSTHTRCENTILCHEAAWERAKLAIDHQVNGHPNLHRTYYIILLRPAVLELKTYTLLQGKTLFFFLISALKARGTQLTSPENFFYFLYTSAF